MRGFYVRSMIFVGLPYTAGAAGMHEEAPPSPSPTTSICPDGQVWDVDEAECVPIAETGLVTDPSSLIGTVRELAYAGRHDDALALLARAPNQDETMVQTYLGYSLRSMGDMEIGRASKSSNVETVATN